MPPLDKTLINIILVFFTTYLNLASYPGVQKVEGTPGTHSLRMHLYYNIVTMQHF